MRLTAKHLEHYLTVLLMSPIFLSIVLLFVESEASYKKFFLLHYGVFFLAGADEKW